MWFSRLCFCSGTKAPAVRLLAGTLRMALCFTVVEWASGCLFAAQWFLTFPLWVTQGSRVGVSGVQQSVTSDHRKQLSLHRKQSSLHRKQLSFHRKQPSLHRK